MKKGFFITGTDTGVGKTIVAGAFTKALMSMGLNTAVMKPIETGCIRDNNILIPSDGLFLKKISGMNENITVITPCTYEQPLAPLAASEIEGRAVNLEKIFKVYDTLVSNYEAIVVEGIGGLYVPVSKEYFVSDLARQMDLPVVVVARPSLGTINHTLLTVHYAFSKGIIIAGIIINCSSEPTGSIAEETNYQILQELAGVPIIGSLPYLKDFDESAIDSALIRSLDLSVLKRYV